MRTNGRTRTVRRGDSTVQLPRHIIKQGFQLALLTFGLGLGIGFFIGYALTGWLQALMVGVVLLTSFLINRVVP